MACWAELTATRVRSAEWRILRQVDAAYIAACREAAERSAANPASDISEQPMTADLFDALFQ